MCKVSKLKLIQNHTVWTNSFSIVSDILHTKEETNRRKDKMNSKLLKLDGEQFTITESTTNGLCELQIEGLGRKMWVKASDELYGYGYRVYSSGSSWKGNYTNPDDAVEAAAREIISTQKKKNQKELSEDLCDYFEQLS